MANSMIPVSWSFKTADETAPAVSANAPTILTEPGAPRSSSITFTITDAGEGVDLTTLVIDVGLDTVYDWDGSGIPDDGFQPGYDTSSSIVDAGGGAWDVTIVPDSPLPNHTTVGVTVDAQDLAPTPNVMGTFSWNFLTADEVGPAVSANSPTTAYPPGAPTSSLVQFTLSDDGLGVDLENTTVTIDGTLAYSWDGTGSPEDGFQAGFTVGSSIDETGAPNSYIFTIDKTPDYDEIDTILVEVTSQDLATVPNVMTPFSWSFDTADESAPTVTNEDPAPSDIDVLIGQAVVFDITDLGNFSQSTLDNTLNVTIGGTLAVVNGVAQLGYGWGSTPIAGGFQVTVSHPNWPGLTSITVDVTAEDDAGNVISPAHSWSFTTELVDLLAPTLANQNPPASSTGAAYNTDVYFEIDDDLSGVSLTTIQVWINGTLAIDASGLTGGGPWSGIGEPGFTSSGIVADGLGFNVTVVPDADFEEEQVSVRVRCYDYKSNLLDTTYFFETLSSIPILLNQDPFEGQTGVSSSATMSFRVDDPGESGVDRTTLDVKVNGVDAIIDGVLQVADFTGSITEAGTYVDVVLNLATGVLPEGATTIEVYVKDKATPIPKVLDTSYEFSTITTAPTLEDLDPAAGSNDSPVDTTVAFSLRDHGGSGVNASTIEISVGGVVAYSAGSEQNGFTVALDEDPATPEPDYFVEITPPVPFLPGDLVTVEVYCQDFAASELDTSYQFGVSVFKPVAALAYEQIIGAYGSIIQLDGRKSYDPSGLPLTWNWEFAAASPVQIPDGSHVNDSPTPFAPLRENESAVSFIPDMAGTYVVQLTVDNGVLTSDPVYATVTIRSTQVPCGEGLTPDARWLWTVISDFWRLIPDKQYIETIWSSVIQLIGTDLVKLWSNDRNKSLKTIQNTVHRRWQRFEFTTPLLNEPQRVIAGLTDDGDTGQTGDAVGDGAALFYVVEDPGPPEVRKDFSFLDRQDNAKGRVLVVDGSTYVVSRADSTGVTVDPAGLPANLTGATWRIPHLLHVPTIDLEDFKVSAGDVLVMEFTRNDIGVSGELQAQVVGVNGARLGFEFTLEDLTVGGETIDQGQFSQLARDLRLVPKEATDDEAQAAGIALISYMPVGVNLASRPFTPYRITARASYVRHNTAIRVRSDYVSIPSLQEELYQPPVVLRDNWDYILGDGELALQPGLFTLKDPAPEVLWAECSMVSNTPAIENNFGRLVDVFSDDLSERETRVPYLSAVRGLWYAVTSGPTVANIRLGLQILLGLPYAEVRGRILNITENFAQEAGGAMLWLDRILLEEVDEENRSTGRRYIYFYPNVVGIEDNPATGLPYAEGDIVEQWRPLSKGVEVADYVKDPEWWVRSLTGLEILKFFVARASIDGTVFDANDALFAVDFLKKIKPAYVNLAASIFKLFEDDMLADAEDSIGANMALKLYDNVGGSLPTLRADQLSQGVQLWHLDSRPFTVVTPLMLRDVATSDSGGTVVADTTGTWPADIRARTDPTVSTPFVEGDILVILPGQPGAGGDYAGMYEIGARLSSTRVRLDYVAPAQEPTTYLRTALDPGLFPYGSGLTCCVIRRLANPLVLAGTLSTSSDVATDLVTELLEARVAVDDHLVISAGEVDAGEYRIKTVGAHAMNVTHLDGSPVSFVGGAGQAYRVIRPRLVLRNVELTGFEYAAGELTLVAHDTGAPTLARDVFTPGMVGQSVFVNSTNVANNGNYTITGYIDPSRVKVASATGSATGTGQAVISSVWHPAFEDASELVPTESFQATVA